ncbi:thiamine pyrophosphate-dependent enzyme [Mesorhizobium sp. B2-4-19]|uniref:thiamine pyrophosphate-dependent enzyme n=1 Tax=Mesorhizobium sp. B2-4-19 TaxID=2589930 RepID=UPI0015E44B9E|nr:thiamine pyrophosphate-dependent enzyme [Mesorhizobium sp. B2-4-19]
MAMRPERYRDAVVPHIYIDGADAAVRFYKAAFGDLDTAVRYDLPLTIIILNDEGFGQERHALGHKGLPERHARYASPDFARESWRARPAARGAGWP